MLLEFTLVDVLLTKLVVHPFASFTAVDSHVCFDVFGFLPAGQVSIHF